MATPTYRHLSVYFPPENRLTIDAMAKAEGISRSSIVNRAVEFYAQHQNTLELSNGQKK